jgi:Kef-type K+ transport system membrane component KefB
MTKSGQLAIRMSMLLIAALAVFAEQFDLDLALGAFAAGMAVGLAVRNAHVEVLHHKFDAVGFGFLIPIFFVSSGLQLDVRAVFSSARSVGMMLSYAGLLLLIRGVPNVLFRSLLAQRQTLALGFYSATSLSLIVALTGTAVQRGLMGADSGAALVGGGLISVMLFPVLGTRFAGKTAELRAAPVQNEEAY